ncbi:50S ribosomal protein L4 [Candidatus Daviesbacteria bacterium]|nr:50S ribosomal protein L4 [Candidatus Daviesbacteria bacterium]
MPKVKKVGSSSRQSSVKKTTKPVVRKSSALSIPVYSLTGRTSGTMTLPKEIFGADVNKKLLAQAIRVYSTNQKTITASTKTRGEVRGSTAKIYRQKGTGRARHGAIRAPIFVGGGIVFGPKPKTVRLELPKKMKKVSLISALSSKAIDKSIIGVSGLAKATGQTKEIAKFMSSVVSRGASALIVIGEKTDNAVRAARNIPGINVLPVNTINAYEILKHDILVLAKEALERLSGKAEKR